VHRFKFGKVESRLLWITPSAIQNARQVWVLPSCVYDPLCMMGSVIYLNLIDPFFFLIGPVHLAGLLLFTGPFFLAGPLYLMGTLGNKR
jgi:hypothetical protein